MAKRGIGWAGHSRTNRNGGKARHSPTGGRWRGSLRPVPRAGSPQRPVLGRLGPFPARRAEPHRRKLVESWARNFEPHQRRCRRPNGRGLEHSGRSRRECYGGPSPCRAGEVSATWPRFTAAAPTVPCRHPRRPDRSPPSHDGGEGPDQLDSGLFRRRGVREPRRHSNFPRAPVKHIDTCPMALQLHGVAIVSFAGDHKTSRANGGISPDL